MLSIQWLSNDDENLIKLGWVTSQVAIKCIIFNNLNGWRFKRKKPAKFPLRPHGHFLFYPKNRFFKNHRINKCNSVEQKIMKNLFPENLSNSSSCFSEFLLNFFFFSLLDNHCVDTIKREKYSNILYKIRLRSMLRIV